MMSFSEKIWCYCLRRYDVIFWEDMVSLSMKIWHHFLGRYIVSFSEKIWCHCLRRYDIIFWEDTLCHFLGRLWCHCPIDSTWYYYLFLLISQNNANKFLYTFQLTIHYMLANAATSMLLICNKHEGLLPYLT